MENGNPRKCPAGVLLLLCFLLYGLAVASYAVWLHQQHKADLIREIDASLLQAARSLKFLLAEDFHDRAIDTDSIAFDEELRNRDAVNRFAAESGFTWLYTLAEKDGRFHFSAPTVSEEEAVEQKVWYFHPYDDIPDEFARAFADDQPAFVEYTDQWGTFRSAALPQVSPGGRRYLACADREIGEIRSVIRQSVVQSVLVSGFFLLAGLPFMLVLICVFRTHTADLNRMNAELQAHKDNLEKLVQERTAELRLETQRLQEALANVKVLGGLVPICASCKKVRDDQGYWDQLERYVQTHSDVLFSHGLCPDCTGKLYPNLSP